MLEDAEARLAALREEVASYLFEAVDSCLIFSFAEYT